MSAEQIVNTIPDGVVEKKRKLDDVAAPPPDVQLLIKRHSDKAKLPTRGSAYAAGYDLYRYITHYAFVQALLTSLKVLRKHLFPPEEGESWTHRFLLQSL